MEPVIIGAVAEAAPVGLTQVAMGAPVAVAVAVYTEVTQQVQEMEMGLTLAEMVLPAQILMAVQAVQTLGEVEAAALTLPVSVVQEVQE